MPRIRVSAPIVNPHAARALWYDTHRWPTFVDGFRTVVRQDPEWPQSGLLVWDSGPHGQGRTREQVVAPDVVAVETEQLEGRRTVRFGEGSLEVELEYELKASNPLFGFFVRRALRDSMQRTLRRFLIELDASHSL